MITPLSKAYLGMTLSITVVSLWKEKINKNYEFRVFLRQC